MDDHSFDKIKDISRMDVSVLVGDLVEELHMDCSKKLDPDIFAHTVKKFTALLCDTQFRDLVWKTVVNITKMGITSSYGAYTRIDYQTLASWVYRAQPSKQNYADKSEAEAREMSNTTVGDFQNISHLWNEFRMYLEDNHLWFLDNISEHNCKMYHAAKASKSLDSFCDMLATEPDPAFFDHIKNLTLEQAKKIHENEQVFG